MSVSPSSLPPIQDMPPKGGYPQVKFERHLPSRGPKGWQMWAGVTAFICYGFVQVARTNNERNQQKLQERANRYAIAPILQAEEDRLYMLREYNNLKKEAEIMKNVPGWKVGKNPYNSGKWMPRSVNDFKQSI
mmetsp:Transcript_18382/g.23854  ORF Transcript_18382/g.23854 Transcript_18382/m.23854 type:complete len:133 (+) Transcript_18382:131-529(+)|eukprot:CAMPEP_0116061476 /NCGR_PEP_ID=MMETSP0322-20121206/7114_1 /TAXON_ID=163516 /ORGANISM="Leptocylindrus danicus var. apora, Strain B651" /LENGTH=132 /DNA_ID=CAMNT_0003546455 /DNA_START=182 /DNA_END=580 /DNA_ORIENTATION=+